jgi:hypothetical protein
MFLYRTDGSMAEFSVMLFHLQFTHGLHSAAAQVWRFLVDHYLLAQESPFLAV